MILGSSEHPIFMGCHALVSPPAWRYARCVNKGETMWRVLVVDDDAGMREFFAGSVVRCKGLALSTELSTQTDGQH